MSIGRRPKQLSFDRVVVVLHLVAPTHLRHDHHLEPGFGGLVLGAVRGTVRLRISTERTNKIAIRVYSLIFIAESLMRARVLDASSKVHHKKETHANCPRDKCFGSQSNTSTICAI